MPDSNQMFAFWEWMPAASFVTILFPILAILPYATSYAEEHWNEALVLLFSRCSRKRIYMSKLLTCFIATAQLLFEPFAVNLIFCNIFFPHNYNMYFAEYQMPNYYGCLLGTNTFVGTSHPELAFYKLFISSPFAYNLLYLLLFSAAGGFMACIVLSLSFVLRTRKILLYIPVFGFTVFMRALETGNSNFSESTVNYTNLDLMNYVTLKTTFGRDYRILIPFLFIGLLMIIGFTAIADKNDLRSIQ